MWLWAKRGGSVNIICGWVVKLENWGWRKKCDEHKRLSLQKVTKEKYMRVEAKRRKEGVKWKERMNEENGVKWNELGRKI